MLESQHKLGLHVELSVSIANYPAYECVPGTARNRPIICISSDKYDVSKFSLCLWDIWSFKFVLPKESIIHITANFEPPPSPPTFTKFAFVSVVPAHYSEVSKRGWRGGDWQEAGPEMQQKLIPKFFLPLS